MICEGWGLAGSLPEIMVLAEYSGFSVLEAAILGHLMAVDSKNEELLVVMSVLVASLGVVGMGESTPIVNCERRSILPI